MSSLKSWKLDSVSVHKSLRGEHFIALHPVSQSNRAQVLIDVSSVQLYCFPPLVCPFAPSLHYSMFYRTKCIILAKNMKDAAIVVISETNVIIISLTYHYCPWWHIDYHLLCHNHCKVSRIIGFFCRQVFQNTQIFVFVFIRMHFCKAL